MNISFAIDDNLFDQADKIAKSVNKPLTELLTEYLSQLARQADIHKKDDSYRECFVPYMPLKRIFGIDAGKGWISEDFDAPLPDKIICNG